MALGGGAITERENIVPRLSSYLKFTNMYGTDDNFRSGLEPASKFAQNLAFAPHGRFGKIDQ
ncbi:MAG: hypothetical protein GEU26_06525 [Nitrososphaeraceae archaeon]|nr:hypothetical protein [Nitrososphaeraceae archaeon]